MMPSHRRTAFRAPLAATIALVAWGLLPTPADAGLIQWLAEVNAGTPSTFVATNVFTPSFANIGALSGDITYEFIVNGADRATAGSLLGSFTGGQNQAIRFEQWLNTGFYGATQYGVDDYVFPTLTTFDSDVHLAFVVNSAAGKTSLYVNGADTGQTVPFALTLHGTVAIGGTDMGGFFLGDDSFAGTIIGLATYDSALSPAELKAHSDAFFNTVAVPAPPTWTMLAGAGIVGLAVRRVRLGRRVSGSLRW